MTGLFFGSFNPIHNGHLKIAQYLLYKGYCQRIWFVVSPHNPLKSDRSLLDEQKRLEIVKAAISGDERMQSCDVEFGLPKPSYTYATLQLLKKKWPEEEFALIIGEDNLRDFHKWRNAKEIVENYRILVYPRKGEGVSASMWENLFLIDAPLADVSSTEIREMLGEGQDISPYVPQPALPLILNYYSVK